MTSMTEMRNIINFFAHKYNGNWDKIYDAIKNREFIHPLELDEFNEKMYENRICIVDETYPENFKKIYMPPFNLYFYGNAKLLHSPKIISLWGEYGTMQIHNLNIDFNNVTLAIDLNDNIDIIEKLIKSKYCLILVDKKPLSNKIKIFLDKLNHNNYCYISEYPSFTNEFDKCDEQYHERLLMGVSNKSVIFSLQEPMFNLCHDLHKQEHRTIYVFDKNNQYEYNNNALIRPIQNISQICN